MGDIVPLARRPEALAHWAFVDRCARRTAASLLAELRGAGIEMAPRYRRDKPLLAIALWFATGRDAWLAAGSPAPPDADAGGDGAGAGLEGEDGVRAMLARLRGPVLTQSDAIQDAIRDARGAIAATDVRICTAPRAAALAVPDAARSRAPAPTLDPGGQAVIPGAERIADKALAQRRMAAPLAPKRPQIPLDIGLFDATAARQRDLFDAPKSGSGP